MPEPTPTAAARHAATLRKLNLGIAIAKLITLVIADAKHNEG